MWPLFLSSSYFAREPRGISTNTSTTSGFAFAGMRPPRVGVRGRDDDGDPALRTLAWIREGGRARVRHEGDVPPAIELPDEDADLALVVELGVRREVLRADLVAPQEDLGVPGVLAGDHVDLLQDLQRARRDVLEVPDRRRDEVERPRPASIAGTFAAMSRAVDEFVKRRVAPELRPVVT